MEEFEFWRRTIIEKFVSGELQYEGVIALDRKLKRVYELGYYQGRLEGEKYTNQEVFK